MTRPLDNVSVERVLTIKNKLGLHARAAAQLVQTAARFESSVSLSNDEQVVDGKSILSVMTLAAGQGSTIQVTAAGCDAAEAVAAIEELVDCLFHEGE